MLGKGREGEAEVPEGEGTCPREAVRQRGRGPCVNPGPKPLVHALQPHGPSLTKHTFEDKIIRNLKMVTTEH